jgi:hypothetical protein
MQPSSTKSVKALTCRVQISGVRAKVDGSLGISLSTPELSADEKAVFMEWMNRDLAMMLQNDTEAVGDVKEVKGEFDTKTPSQRLRAVMFVYWKQCGASGEFETFYLQRMEKIIDEIKTHLAQP